MVWSPRGLDIGCSLLEGAKVLSLGAFVWGNVRPLILAELGADVVKVESRRRPDPREHPPDHGEVFEPSEKQNSTVALMYHSQYAERNASRSRRPKVKSCCKC